MCGIAGTWGRESGGGARTADAMTATLIHRGPDDVGSYARPGVRLGVRRLSIVDVAGGTQPFYDETGRICMVANGEIYNHDELRAKLRARGHRFASRCDIEVIVHLYEEYGDRCVDHLRGMFAFAIADGDRLLLARDRLGIKPLYHADVPGGVAFASEMKALLRHPDVRPRLDLQAFADSRALGYPVGDRTFIDGIRCLLPGHTMVVTKGPDGPTSEVTRYYRLPATHDESVSFDSAQDQLIETLRETVRSHLTADVEVGLILSGGLDSAVLAMLARDAGRPPHAFSVASEPGHPDLVQAGRLATGLGLPHSVTVMTFEDYLAAIPGFTHAQEVPGNLGNVGLYRLYRQAGTSLKACLNGEGADEIFGGYPEYLDQEHIGRFVKDRLRRLAAYGGSDIKPSAEVLEIIYAVARPRQSYEAYLERVFVHNLRDQLVRQHLEPVDKCAMAAGVEMRVPFMDHRLVELVLTLPTRYKVDSTFEIQKHVLKRAALRAWGADGPIADSVLRRKIGVPMATGYRKKFDAMCERRLPDDYLARHELGPYFVRKADLLLHELFTEIFLTGRGATPTELSLDDFISERAGRALASGSRLR